jgi:hypothetical protein
MAHHEKKHELTATQYGSVDRSAQERILADAMVEVATELRLADLTELFLMIRSDQAANLADLINSSSELFFKNGALKYALSAGCELRWESAPTVQLDLEFRHATVTVFFRLTIGRAGWGRSARCLLRRRRLFGKRQREGTPLRRHLRCAAALSQPPMFVRGKAWRRGPSGFAF